jgi:hypothetical protein
MMEPAANIPDGSTVMFPTGQHLWLLKNSKVYGITCNWYKNAGKPVEPNDLFYVVERSLEVTADEQVIVATGEPIYEPF